VLTQLAQGYGLVRIELGERARVFTGSYVRDDALVTGAEALPNTFVDPSEVPVPGS
jgi:hypothetical protein